MVARAFTVEDQPRCPHRCDAHRRQLDRAVGELEDERTTIDEVNPARACLGIGAGPRRPDEQVIEAVVVDVACQGDGGSRQIPGGLSVEHDAAQGRSGAGGQIAEIQAHRGQLVETGISEDQVDLPRAGSVGGGEGGADEEVGNADFLIGAPFASPHGAGSGKVYLVFGNPGLDELAPVSLNLGNLAACAAPTLCGIVFNGEAAGDLAGATIALAGDINHDGFDDLLIGAPGASPNSKTGAGRVYLVYGGPFIFQFSHGTIELSSVGVTPMGTPGLVFNGESAGDHAGQSVSPWEDFNNDPLYADGMD